ncbi:MAG TPA: PACE efflux transporter [Noviherbaspirillum sp.]
MQGIKRKVVYVSVFEAIAIVVCSLGFAALSDRSLGHASVLSVATSVVAVLWNFFFTMMFEAWEARQPVRGRSVARRMAHAAIFEAGLVILLVPLIAWWLEVSLLRALVMDLGLAAFFLAYTFVFNWCFDRIFGLPASAAPAPSRP